MALAGVRRHQVGTRMVAAAFALLALGTAGCSDNGTGESGSQTEEQELDQYRSHRSDLVVTATVSITSESTRTLHVRVETAKHGGDVTDVRVHLTVNGGASVLMPLPEVNYIGPEWTTCTATGSIECRLDWLASPPVPTDGTPQRPAVVDLNFLFEVTSADGPTPPTVTVTVDNSIGGGFEERDIDETPENNTVTVEL